MSYNDMAIINMFPFIIGKVLTGKELRFKKLLVEVMFPFLIGKVLTKLKLSKS